MAEESFEEALSRLEEIVKRLEAGGLSLEESLAAFEEGVRLSRLCAARLEEAEKRVEILVKEGGLLKAKPFSPQEKEEDESAGLPQGEEGSR